jgi:hypothetical protein
MLLGSSSPPCSSPPPGACTVTGCVAAGLCCLATLFIPLFASSRVRARATTSVHKTRKTCRIDYLQQLLDKGLHLQNADQNTTVHPPAVSASRSAFCSSTPPRMHSQDFWVFLSLFSSCTVPIAPPLSRLLEICPRVNWI